MTFLVYSEGGLFCFVKDCVALPMVDVGFGVAKALKPFIKACFPELARALVAMAPASLAVTAVAPTLSTRFFVVLGSDVALLVPCSPLRKLPRGSFGVDGEALDGDGC